MMGLFEKLIKNEGKLAKKKKYPFIDITKHCEISYQ